MNSLDSTFELPQSTLPLSNPKPILQQTKSIITTNPFIIPTENKPETITFKDINKGVSETFIGIFDDLFNKPNDENWGDYLKMITAKDDRFRYLIVLLFFIALYILLIK